MRDTHSDTGATDEGARSGSGEIRIRRATSDDVALVAEFGARTFRDTFAARNTEEDMTSYLASAFSPARMAAELCDADSTFLMAEVDGETVGYSRLRVGAAPDCIAGDSPIEIVRFYADRRWIGKGVGRSLMTACLSRAVADRHDVVWLDVWDQNERAIAFYSKWGFEVVGEQDFALGKDVQHDLLMVRSAG